MSQENIKKIFFASDFHLQGAQFTRDRLEHILNWMDQIADEASAIYLLGDVFDFWFEYKTVIPNGFSKFLAKIQELRKKNIEIFMLGGNHDIWIGDFFEKELDVRIIKSGTVLILKGKRFYVHHGDGLDANNRMGRLLKRIFTNKICVWIFAALHPNIGIKLMRYFSRKSRENESHFAANHPIDQWPDYLHALAINSSQKCDYYLFGHMHVAGQRTISQGGGVYINLGEWITQRSYAEFDGENINLKFYNNENGIIRS